MLWPDPPHHWDQGTTRMGKPLKSSPGDMVIQATERNFCVSCNESIKKGRIPSGEAWANPCSVNASFAGPCVRHLSWLQPQPRGQQGTGAGWDSALSNAGVCETPYGGKNLPTTEAPVVQGCSPSKICLCLPGSALADEEDEPSGCDGTGGTALLGKCLLLGCTSAPRPPRLCLLHWPSCGHGTLRAPHQQPQQSCHTKFWLLLGTTGLEGCQGSGGKILLTCCSETCTHKCSF